MRKANLYESSYNLDEHDKMHKNIKRLVFIFENYIYI